MGVLTTSGSLARVVGPVFVSYIYQEFGTWLLFGLVTGSLVISFLISLISYRVLIPYNQLSKDLSVLDQLQFWKGWNGIWQKTQEQ